MTSEQSSQSLSDPHSQPVADGREEVNEVISKTVALLNTIKNNAKSAVESARNLLFRLKDKHLPTENGISFLDIKNEMLLSYLIDLTYLMLNKIEGKSFDDAVKRLVEHRTVLEKMRPIDFKLKYQIDKLINAATTGVVSSDDPMRLRPQIANLMDDDNQSDSDEDSEAGPAKAKGKSKESDVYVAPRVAAVRYDAEEEKNKRILDRAKKRAMNSSVIEELKREFDDAPEEMKEAGSFAKKRLAKEFKKRTEYEEENFMRFQLTKKQRNETKQIMAMSSLSGVTQFEDISALDVDNLDEFKVQKKRKGSAKKNNKFKKSKKFKKLKK